MPHWSLWIIGSISAQMFVARQLIPIEQGPIAAAQSRQWGAGLYAPHLPLRKGPGTAGAPNIALSDLLGHPQAR